MTKIIIRELCMVDKIKSEMWAVSGWREGSRVWYLLTRLNKWDLRRVLDVVREGDFLTVSGRLFQVSAKAKLILVLTVTEQH